MCLNAQPKVVGLMKAIRPTILSLLAFLGQTSTPAGVAVINAYDAALAAVEAWKSGTSAENALQLIGDLQVVFNAFVQALPVVPQNVVVLINIILAGLEAVVGMLAGNSPVTEAPADATASAEEIQEQHQLHVAYDTKAKVGTLVPDFQFSPWHSPASQYNKTWNKGVDEGGFPASMKAA